MTAAKMFLSQLWACGWRVVVSRPALVLILFVAPQGPDLDYSKFLHSSQRHSSLACTACHERNGDNSALPVFPGHKQCTGCHLGQFTTPAVPMCLICHTDPTGAKPPLKGFPA